MKRVLWTVGGICAAAAGIIVWHQSSRNPGVEALAHRLEDAWADHHTAV